MAGEALPNLPPDEVVAKVLRANHSVAAASSQIRVEEANKERLEAGSYEWNLRFGAHQRKVAPAIGSDERYNEWNAALERPLRLPGTKLPGLKWSSQHLDEGGADGDDETAHPC